MSRSDLYRRLELAHQATLRSRREAARASLDRGALITSLVADGASYSQIAAHLPGEDGRPISKQRVMRLLRDYEQACDARALRRSR